MNYVPSGGRERDRERQAGREWLSYYAFCIRRCVRLSNFKCVEIISGSFGLMQCLNACVENLRKIRVCKGIEIVIYYPYYCFRVQSIEMVIRLLVEFSKLLSSLCTYKEVFSPVSYMLDKLPVEKYPGTLQV